MQEHPSDLGSTAAPSTASGLADVPADFLRQLFARLDYKDLCTAASTCRTFKQLTVDSWRGLAERRWLYGRECPRWQQAAAAGEWKRLYRERHQLDRRLRSALGDLPWPLRRDAALSDLAGGGEEAVDELLRQAGSWPGRWLEPPPRPQHQQQQQEEEDGKDQEGVGRAAVACGERDGEPGLALGRKYWAERALSELRKRQAVAALRALGTDPRVAEQRLEAGALAMAQAHYPTACDAAPAVSRLLDAVGEELARRMREEGAAPGSMRALELLNHLLFGPPPPADHHHHSHHHSHHPTATAAPAPSSAPAAASAPSTPPAFPHWLVPPPGHGLGLKGDDSDYYNPANSLLHDVLLPTQPPPQLQVTPSPQPTTPAMGRAAPAQADAPAGPLTALLPPTPSAGGRTDTGGASVGEGAAAAGGGSSAAVGAASGEVQGVPAAACWPRPRLSGIPITLGLIHAAVGRRAGAGRIDMMGTPMRVVNRFVLEDDAGAGGGGSGTQQAQSSVPAGQQETKEREVFVDVFGGGKIMSFEDVRDLISAGMPFHMERSQVRPMAPRQIYERMCANLLNIYRDRRSLPCLRLVMELSEAVRSQQPLELLSQLVGVHSAMDEWGAAEEALRRLEGAAEELRSTAAAAAAAGAAASGTWLGDTLATRRLTDHATKMREDLAASRDAWRAEVARVKRRPPEVLFPVGTVMQHRTRGYHGVVVDWDTHCCMDEQWIQTMEVDTLPGGGRRQPFYRVLVSDRAAEEQAAGVGPALGGGRRQSAAAAAAGLGGTARVHPAQRGVHNSAEAEETYVAQINMQVVLPAQPPAATCAAATCTPHSTTATAATEQQEAERQLAEDPVPAGVAAVVLPYDYQVRHPDVGRYFEGRRPGQRRYTPNAAMKHRFPLDWPPGGQEGEEEGAEGEQMEE